MKRNYGIDLLRMVLMFMVVILHILGHGGVLGATSQLTVKYGAAWLLETFAYCAVNCYALISGYVNYSSRYKFSSLLQIWLQALVYSVGIAACMWIWKPEDFSVGGLVSVCLPVLKGGYWYLTAYVGLFVLIPFLNAGINALSEEKAKAYLWLLFCAFSVLPTLARKDVFLTNSGYSAFWLAYLYLIGGCLKKFQWGESLRIWQAALVYIGCVLLSWGIKMGTEGITACLSDGPKSYVNFISYISPTMVMATVSLFFTFQKCRVPQKLIRLISEFSPAAFGVYLIHEHKMIRSQFVAKKFGFLAEFSAPGMIIGVIGSAAAIFLSCLLIDWIRHKIFIRAHVKEHLERLEKKWGHFHSLVQ